MGHPEGGRLGGLGQDEDIEQRLTETIRLIRDGEPRTAT